MKLRTFVAVSIPDDVRSRALAAARQLAAVAPDVKWVEPQSLHWTLNFLGNVDQREIAEICATVAEAALEHEPFDLELCGAGAFPAPIGRERSGSE